MESVDVKRRLSATSAAAPTSDQAHDIKRLKSVDQEQNGEVFKRTPSAKEKRRSLKQMGHTGAILRSPSPDALVQPFFRAPVQETSGNDAAPTLIPTAPIHATHGENEKDLEQLYLTSQNTVEMESQHLEDADKLGQTVEMLSQSQFLGDDDPDMFDESQCFVEDTLYSKRCQFLRRISDAILLEGLDECDGPRDDSQCDSIPEEKEEETCFMNIVTYLQTQVDATTQTTIAKYLSSGSLEYATLTVQNIHHFYHVASCLHLKQLRDHCLTFCFQNNQTDIVTRFEGCDCQMEIQKQSSCGYQRSQSLISNPDDSEPPQYFIVFTDNSADDTDNSSDKRKVTVMVIDMSEKLDVFNKVVDKRLFGSGFACCSCEVKESPYVFVSGGVGKGNQMMKYDVLLGRWSKCAKMPQARSQHMMLSVGENAIFAIGGKETSCIDEYDIKRNKWFTRASMVTQVIDATTLCYNNKIYIFGGTTEAGPIGAIQCYDVITHSIQRVGDLPCSFAGANCVVFQDRIYIATHAGHMICYNPATGVSDLCARQPIERRQFGMFVKNERIYFVGGVVCNHDNSDGGKPQYRYNPVKDMWVEKYKLCHNFPVLANCIINYPKKCSVIPFNEQF